MSEYKRCRECDEDLMWNGRGFGAMECCCNQGYCMNCCPEVVEQRTRAAGQPAHGGEKG